MDNTLKAIDLLRQAALEYSGAEYKFYNSGFIKYVNKGDFIFIEDIYTIPEHRGELTKYMVSSFVQFAREEQAMGIYGNVYHANKKSLDKFLKWGLRKLKTTDEYTVVLMDLQEVVIG